MSASNAETILSGLKDILGPNPPSSILFGAPALSLQQLERSLSLPPSSLTPTEVIDQANTIGEIWFPTPRQPKHRRLQRAGGQEDWIVWRDNPGGAHRPLDKYKGSEKPLLHYDGNRRDGSGVKNGGKNGDEGLSRTIHLLPGLPGSIPLPPSPLPSPSISPSPATATAGATTKVSMPSPLRFLHPNKSTSNIDQTPSISSSSSEQPGDAKTEKGKTKSPFWKPLFTRSKKGSTPSVETNHPERSAKTAVGEVQAEEGEKDQIKLDLPPPHRITSKVFDAIPTITEPIRPVPANPSIPQVPEIKLQPPPSRISKINESTLRAPPPRYTPTSKSSKTNSSSSSISTPTIKSSPSSKSPVPNIDNRMDPNGGKPPIYDTFSSNAIPKPNDNGKQEMNGPYPVFRPPPPPLRPSVLPTSLLPGAPIIISPTSRTFPRESNPSDSRPQAIHISNSTSPINTTSEGRSKSTRSAATSGLQDEKIKTRLQNNELDVQIGDTTDTVPEISSDNDNDNNNDNDNDDDENTLSTPTSSTSSLSSLSLFSSDESRPSSPGTSPPSTPFLAVALADLPFLPAPSTLGKNGSSGSLSSVDLGEWVSESWPILGGQVLGMLVFVWGVHQVGL